MSGSQKTTALLRKSFGKIPQVVQLPDLIEVQSKSYNDFIQFDYLPSERSYMGLEKVLRDIFPIDYNGRIALEYVSYEIGEWACICGAVVGIENRYRWVDLKTKKEGSGRLPKDQGDRRYKLCKKCSSRVGLKLYSTVEECRYSGKTYALPLKVRMQLTTWDVNDETGERVVRDIKEQEVFFCDLPVMIDLHEDADGMIRLGNQGTFLINGVDRVVVSQIHRAPGVVFSLSKKLKDFRGYSYHVARLIPSRGSWLDFEFDSSDFLYVRIDKKKKVLATTFLQAIGFTREEILPLFYETDVIKITKKGFERSLTKSLIGQRIEAGSLPETLASKFPTGQRITAEVFEALKAAGVKTLLVRPNIVVNRVLAKDVVDNVTGEVLFYQGHQLVADDIEELAKSGNVGEVELVRSGGYVVPPFMALTLGADKVNNYADALREVYYRLRPGDIPTVQIMEEYIKNIFFNPRFYDMTLVGRLRTNRKLGLNIAENITHLTKEDIIATIKYLVRLRERGEGELDDIDHLGNRCVRLVGELMENQLYLGFARIEKIVRERFRLQENAAAMMPYDFLNVKPLAAVMREFFGTGQLSQFMDQTNPLAEMAHKRRISALGPGGVTRERATFEVRDVHTSHYGRICPIETPEGQNVGLISSLSTYARVNELGFIETTYRPVVNGVVQDEVVFLDAFQEEDKNIAQAVTPVDKNGKITLDKVQVRCNGDIITVDATDVHYVDASPRQMVSVATALIPFLEHDDANRALMGSNMQRQAVPLVTPDSPIVGTGMETDVGVSQGVVLTARNNGVVEYASADKIVVRLDETGSDERWFARPIDIYELKKFGRSSHNTWVHQTPIVKVGQRVEVGDVLTNGAATTNGELSLGSNVLMAFMPWHGYNFEDAIVASKRLVVDDVFTSVHIEEFVVEARDTKLGAEEITKDIPNVSERELEALDDDGIVYIGSRVKPGDILVGKVTLKGDVQVSPEEKLLRAIFGEKSREVRDTSLRVPPGIEATVVDVKIFSRSGIRKDKRYKEIVAKETERIEENYAHQLRILHDAIRQKVEHLLTQVDSKKFTASKLSEMAMSDLLAVKVSSKEVAEKMHRYQEVLQSQEQVIAALKEDRIAKLRKGDDLPSGVIKMVRVYVAMKRPLSVGDKMAGRHGNKGIVSRIVNVEDMPYMADGVSVDLVLNPLGVPGRMNVGQLLETLLGMAGKKIGDEMKRHINDMAYTEIKKRLIALYDKQAIAALEETGGKEAVENLAHGIARKGMQYESPVFDGADYAQQISPLLVQHGLSADGTYHLYDGLTGEQFEQRVTVGCIYMMKLNHLADDKLHARSVGPYSLITQQPLGGKAQFGGQRLGEMEVWALYAHGASYTLQEMLTLKSDDVNGRVKAYEAIVRGDEVPDPGIPESFNVLVKELQSLGLAVELFRTNKEQVGE